MPRIHYTFDKIYEAKVAELTDAFIDENDRNPNHGEENSISAEARRYAKEFMEHYEAWQEDQGHEERQREIDRYGE
jgi:hypothetical protein